MQFSSYFTSVACLASSWTISIPTYTLCAACLAEVYQLDILFVKPGGFCRCACVDNMIFKLNGNEKDRMPFLWHHVRVTFLRKWNNITLTVQRNKAHV